MADGGANTVGHLVQSGSGFCAMRHALFADPNRLTHHGETIVDEVTLVVRQSFGE
jgi:hypothetical protein